MDGLDFTRGVKTHSLIDDIHTYSQVSLFLDVLMSMCHDVSEEVFLSRNISHKLTNARAVLWKELHDLPLSMGRCLKSPADNTILTAYQGQETI